MVMSSQKHCLCTDSLAKVRMICRVHDDQDVLWCLVMEEYSKVDQYELCSFITASRWRRGAICARETNCFFGKHTLVLSWHECQRTDTGLDWPWYQQELTSWPTASKTQNRRSPEWEGRELQALTPQEVLQHCWNHGWNVQHGLRAFSHSAPRLWNALPPDLRTDLSDLSIFKSHLKASLFRLAYPLLHHHSQHFTFS